jgi:hypothetical protein
MIPDLASSLRCPHLPAEAHGLGAVWCPYCGWVEDGLRQTPQQVMVRHPELRAQVQANQALQTASTKPPARRPSRPGESSDENLARIAEAGNPIARTFAWTVLLGKVIVLGCAVILALFFGYLMLYVFFLGAHPLA